MARNPHDDAPEVSEALFEQPCPEDVRKMPRTGGGHHCASCAKSVVDLSQLPLEEAARTLRHADERLCVSYSVVEDGRLVFGARSRARVAISLAAFLSACAAPETETDPEPLPTVEAQESSCESVGDEKFATVEDAPRLQAPILQAPDDTWPAATRASDVDGKRHLPIVQDHPPKPRQLQPLGGAPKPKAGKRRIPKPVPRPAGGIRPAPRPGGSGTTAGVPTRIDF